MKTHLTMIFLIILIFFFLYFNQFMIKEKSTIPLNEASMYIAITDFIIQDPIDSSYFVFSFNIIYWNPMNKMTEGMFMGYNDPPIDFDYVDIYSLYNNTLAFSIEQSTEYRGPFYFPPGITREASKLRFNIYNKTASASILATDPNLIQGLYTISPDPQQNLLKEVYLYSAYLHINQTGSSIDYDELHQDFGEANIVSTPKFYEYINPIIVGIIIFFILTERNYIKYKLRGYEQKPKPFDQNNLYPKNKND